MANSLKFSLVNIAETMILQNGTGGGAPALDYIAPWTVPMAQNRDRGMPWQGTATGNVDLTVPGASGVTANFDLFAVLGHRGAPSSAVGIASVEIFTQTGAYTPGGTWTSRGTITLGSGVRDGKLLLGAPIAVKSVRFTITASSGFTIGRLFAGAVEVDLGIVSSPGYTRKRIIQRLTNRDGGGMPTMTQFGDPRWEYSLPYGSIQATVFNKLLNVGSQARSFVLLDRDDTVFEAILRDGTFSHSLNRNQPADVHDASLELETLP